jgi:hypothetical protein
MSSMVEDGSWYLCGAIVGSLFGAALLVDAFLPNSMRFARWTAGKRSWQTSRISSLLSGFAFLVFSVGLANVSCRFLIEKWQIGALLGFSVLLWVSSYYADRSRSRRNSR